MRLSATMIEDDTIDEITKALFGTMNVVKPAGDLRPLYLWSPSKQEAILASMPSSTRRVSCATKKLRQLKTAESVETRRPPGSCRRRPLTR